MRVCVFAGMQNRCLVLNSEEKNTFALSKSLEKFANLPLD